MASPNPQQLDLPSPPPPPLDPPPVPPPQPDEPPHPDEQKTPIPTPMETDTPTATLALTVTVSSTSSDPNNTSNPHTPLSEPPMGVPILIAASSQPSSSSRRLPPPCWTPDETAVLIDAYRSKWYSLRRGNLRAAHWQDVADEIHSSCPEVTPPKTAVQCRHKMEKLRKRYRAELLRAKSIPHHRFNSSWLYFSKMDSMEKGGHAGLPLSSPATASPPVASAMAVAASSPVYDEDDGDDDDEEDNNDEDFSLRSYRQPRSAYYQQRNGLRIRIAGNKNSTPKQRIGGGGYGVDFDDVSPNPNPNYGFPKGIYKSSVNNDANNNSYGTPPGSSHYYGSGGSGGVRGLKNHGNYEFNSSNSGSMGMNYMNMSSGGGGGGVINKKKRKAINRIEKGDREEEREKGEEAVLEMVDAIRMLGEGFVRMEKMKLEMMRETERLRMEMEMKRTEMLLESQHRIVEAFTKGWTEVIGSAGKSNSDDQDNDAS